MKQKTWIEVELEKALRKPVVDLRDVKELRRDIELLAYREYQRTDPWYLMMSQGGPAGGASCEYGDAEGDE